jgi:hypothetical protein
MVINVVSCGYNPVGGIIFPGHVEKLKIIIDPICC